MKTALFLLISLWFNAAADGRTYSDEELAEMREGLDAWRQLAEIAPTLPPAEAFERLGKGVRKTSRQSIYNLENREAVKQQVQAALIAIPGHAEYYRDKIESFTIPYLKAQERWEKDNTLVSDENGNPLGLLMNDLIRQRSWSLSTLQELPSAETLTVLGEMLNDERLKVELLPDKSNGELVVDLRPTSELSALTLREMIENPPTTGDFVYERDMPVWQNWYRQVKEGRRTVRFKGNPQEYSLTGPVREAKNPDIPRATKRPGPAPQEQASDKPPTTPPSRAPWIAAFLATIATLTGWFLLKKRQAS